MDKPVRKKGRFMSMHDVRDLSEKIQTRVFIFPRENEKNFLSWMREVDKKMLKNPQKKVQFVGQRNRKNKKI